MPEKGKPKAIPSEAAAKKPAATTVKPVAPERQNFKVLLLQNPNHFGTFPNLGGKAVLPKKFDTAFEELTCLGLNPEQNKLEAVVQIKQHGGYDDPASATQLASFFKASSEYAAGLEHSIL